MRLLACMTGSVKQELLLPNEYLAAEYRILITKLPPRLRLSNPERMTLAEIGKRMHFGKQLAAVRGMRTELKRFSRGCEPA